MNDSDFPPCQWRVKIAEDGPYFCRHTGVSSNRNLVTASVCLVCSGPETPCSNPRPVPTLEELSKPPTQRRQAWDVARSLTSFVADGLRTVDRPHYEARLEVCDTCDQRRGTRCLQCGCFLAFKARGRTFQCPLEKWPALDSSDDSRANRQRQEIKEAAKNAP